MSREGVSANLDVLRAIAVLCVLLAHILLTLSGNGPGQRVAFGIDVSTLGLAGVLIFFVHTSLVLMLSMERSPARGFRLVRAFYIQRSFRVYPLSMLLCAGVVALGIPRNVLGIPYHSPSIGEFLANAALVQNITGDPLLSDPLWSLPFEIQMYVLLPFIFLAIKRAPLVGSIFFVVFAYFLAGKVRLLGFAPCFAGGILAFGLLKAPRLRLPSWAWPAAILGLLVCYLIYDPHSDSFAKAGLLCIAIGSIVPQFDDLTNNLFRSMTHGIAKYSYGLYLFHYPLLWWFYRHLDMGNTSRFAGYILSLAAISFVSYHLLENPLIRFGKHLSGTIADEPRATASLPPRSPA